MRQSFIFSFVAVAACFSAVAAWGAQFEPVRMADVTALTFYRGQWAQGRRSGVPQLQCVGGGACGQFEPSAVQCVRTGWDGRDAQWKCSAELPNELMFGATTVSCEGYSDPDDQFITRGSCGLEYELRRVAGAHQGYHPPQYTTSNSYNDYDSSNRSGWSTLILLAIVVFVGYNVIKLCSRPINPTAGTAGDYAQYNNAGYNHNHNQGRHDGHWGNKGTGYTAPPAGNNGPGFWTGAGLGGLAGYAMGRNAAPQYQPRYTAPAAAPSYSGSSGGSGPTTHTSTGYGGTKRR